MHLILEVVLIVAALSGWGMVIARVIADRGTATRENRELRQTLQRTSEREEGFRKGFRTLHRRLRRQLEQARLAFEIEETLATQLAAATGGSPTTRKTEARRIATEALGGRIALDARITTPSGIERQLAELETFDPEWTGANHETVDESARGPIGVRLAETHGAPPARQAA